MTMSLSQKECSENLWRHVQQCDINQNQHQQQQVFERLGVPIPMQEEVAAGAKSSEPAPDLRVADLPDAVTQRQICHCSSDHVWYVVAGRGCWMCGCGFPRPEPVDTVEPKPVKPPNPNREEKRPELCVFVCVVQ